ncbi:AMP-binding enzyme [Colletotrichum limetticola]|uniref:AMP-binding enzyme n=1 Tax=Colletotrichum limetticola TaxID=1209924 RepID=A0ABQ9PGU2_9PEZI|nr:AMP-binding enzyme [Colletotrichum limetticola]
MLFVPDQSLPQLPSIPDTVPLCDFMFDEQYGRHPVATSLDPYTCGLSGSSISAQEQKGRVEALARSLAQEFGWSVNQGSEFDKVVGIFALNTVDIMGLSWAVHRLNGISSPANAMYNAEELTHQLVTSKCKALFTVQSLLPVALKAAKAAGIPECCIYLCDMPGQQEAKFEQYETVAELILRGQTLPQLEPIKWNRGQGQRQTAFLCYSSGTSGLPKAVMISHQNVIANIIQLSLFDQADRDAIAPAYRDIGLGLLPQSHIYSLIIICHASTYRGDSVIVLPKFDLNTYLRTIEYFKINTLYLVPPLVIAMINNLETLKKYDLSSVKRVWVGAAPLGLEATNALLSAYPSWKITLGYGMTETCVVVTSGTPRDIVVGSSGLILPGFEIMLVDPDGKRVDTYNEPGEVWVKSPSVVLGYLNNESANRDTFVHTENGRFIKTGDVGEMRKAPSGKEHLWIVDRIKELIKVKGHQVAPAELEACLLGHSSVADCAVISVPDDRAGEVPKAYIVKSGPCSEKDIQEYVQARKAPHKWIKGGIDFVDAIPKSPSGKILRRLLRDPMQIPETMFAWRKHKGNPNPVWEEVPVPMPSPKGVLCKMLASGVCRSDHSLLTIEKQPGWFQDKFILGHEGCGQIIKLGDQVLDSEFKVYGQGDIVALNAVPGCGASHCDECSRDLAQICEVGHHSGIGQDGFYAPYAAIDVRGLAHVPQGVSPAEAAVATDAVTTAYHAVHRRGEVKADETVFLFGLGGLGFNALQIVLNIGARVIVSDIRESLLEEAAAIGVPRADLVPPGKKVQEFVIEQGLTGKIDTVLDFVGTHQTFEDAQQIVRRGGKLLCIGSLDTENTIHMKIGTRKRLSYIFSYGGQVKDLREVLQLIAKGNIRPRVETAKLSDFPDVLERLERGEIKARVALMHG